jgi:uncharacterized iron-regulated membrane protein
MRILHRYLGFFFAGVMAMYAISGIVLVFRDTDFLKSEVQFQKEMTPGLKAESLGKTLKRKGYKVEKEDGQKIIFNGGSYDKSSGIATYTDKKLPLLLDKMTHLHKAKSSQPLFFLNVLFGVSLLFFVVSAFWMFRPSTPVFKKGIYFTLGGVLLTLLLLFV